MAARPGPKAGSTKGPRSFSRYPNTCESSKFQVPSSKKIPSSKLQAGLIGTWNLEPGTWNFPMTVLEVIQRSAEFLARKGVDSPRLQAELLLAHVLQLPRLKLYLDFERRLSDSEADRVRDLIKRRGEREPLQHILGSTSFCGFDIAVSPDVLVPRPETEMLAEMAWEYLQKRGGEPVVLDYGTGSGCITIALAAHCLSARIHALDVSEKAIAIARANAARRNITFHLGNAWPELP